MKRITLKNVSGGYIRSSSIRLMKADEIRSYPEDVVENDDVQRMINSDSPKIKVLKERIAEKENVNTDEETVDTETGQEDVDNVEKKEEEADEVEDEEEESSEEEGEEGEVDDDMTEEEKEDYFTMTEVIDKVDGLENPQEGFGSIDEVRDYLISSANMKMKADELKRIADAIKVEYTSADIKEDVLAKIKGDE